jgi:hypothetical protein
MTHETHLLELHFAAVYAVLLSSHVWQEIPGAFDAKEFFTAKS